MELNEIYFTAFREYKTGNFSAALETLERLQKIYPELKNISYSRAVIYNEQNEFIRAFLALKDLLPRLDSDEKYLAMQAYNLFGVVNRHLAMPDSAIECYCKAAGLAGDNHAACQAISNAFFASNCSENFSKDDFKKLCAEYKKYLSDITPYPRKFYNHKKIRVGFLSADFRIHAVMDWCLTLITGLDKNIFATYFYSNAAANDFVTDYFKSIIKNWRDLSLLTEKQTAQMIRDDEIDILFDLSGHTSGNLLRVAAYRPASVQVSGIGYMNSTGADFIDYFLSDIHCAGGENYFTEKLIRLPQSHFCYTPIRTSELKETPPCLEKNFVTFGSFNQFGKITDSILSAWKIILDEVPDSRLILKDKLFDTIDGQNFCADKLKSFGFDLARVEMRGFSHTFDYLREYDDVDIALDTYPYTGGVTTCGALYMGVPVISLFGDKHGSRFGLSILENVGLAELAVDSLDEYINRAIELSGDKNLLALLRKNLRGMMAKSPLMNQKNYIREVEAAFIKILDTERKLHAGGTKLFPTK